jgi:TolA-binding protein
MHSGNPLYRYLLFLTLAVFLNTAQAQRTALYQSRLYSYAQMQKAFDAGRYAEAQQGFAEMQSGFHPQTPEYVGCEYYKAMCAFELFNEDAEFLLKNFSSRFPDSDWAEQVKFSLGNLYYRRKEYKKAIAAYLETKVNALSTERRNEYHFKLGYSWFVREDFEKAKPLFAEVKDIRNEYAPAATYYFSHICYLEGKYSTALEGFKKFSTKTGFGQVVPYYIVQIYYLQQRYEEAIEYGSRMLDSIPEKRAVGLYRIIGDAYAKTKQYEKALPYLEKFLKTNPVLDRKDYFGFAYVYLQLGQCKNASAYLRKCITQTADSINQLSWYYLGKCELEAGNRKEARNAFGSSCKLRLDEMVRENALFNYAKLSYELDQDPFHDAIKSLRNFLNEYPSSDKYTEAFDLLVNALLRSKNYSEALQVIAGIRKKTPALEKAEATLNYLRATELFNNSRFSESLAYYQKVHPYGGDNKLVASSIYWHAEACYRLNRNDSATAGFTRFLNAPGAALTPVYHEAYYALGYCYFKKKDFKQASASFRNYLSLAEGENLVKFNDAAVRVGDLFFVDRRFTEALDYYAMVKGPAQADYIQFQRAVIYGLQGKTPEKTAGLLALVNGIKKSAYLDDALYELADCYLIMNKNSEALETFKRLMTEHPSSPFVKRAQVKIALIYSNTDQDDLAIQSYRDLVTQYPNTAEASQAVASMREIYVNAGKVSEFESFVNTVPSLNYPRAAIDSASYEAAELKYMKGDCEGAAADFKGYLKKYESPLFRLNALYFLAECNFKLNRQADALEAYAQVGHMPYHSYTERSVTRAASLAFTLQQYDSAYFWYRRMGELMSAPQSQFDALMGKYRCALQLGADEEVVKLANQLIEHEKTSPEFRYECMLNRAKRLLASGNDSTAVNDFQVISRNSKTAKSAEASYCLAEHFLRKNRQEACIAQLEIIINQDPSYDFWVTKAYFMYAVIFEMRNDRFNQRQTLQSIADHSEDPAFVNEARKLLQAIDEKEKEEMEKRRQEYQEIQFDSNSIRDNDLFEEIR